MNLQIARNRSLDHTQKLQELVAAVTSVKFAKELASSDIQSGK